jgi:hypothetical protein
MSCMTVKLIVSGQQSVLNKRDTSPRDWRTEQDQHHMKDRRDKHRERAHLEHTPSSLLTDTLRTLILRIDVLLFGIRAVP